MAGQSYFKLPNSVILDENLYYSSKRVLAAMLAYSSRHGMLRKTTAELAALSQCSPDTVRHALEELERRGYLRKIRTYRFSPSMRRKIYAANAYKLRKKLLEGAYTLIPRRLLRANTTHAQFVVALHLYMSAGRKGRAFPSLRLIAKRLSMGKATVCRAVQALWRSQTVLRNRCRKGNRAYSCSTYYPTDWVRPGGRKDAANSLAVGGGLIFSKHLVSKKDNDGFYSRENTYGVGEFVQFAKFAGFDLFPEPYVFDGAAVRITPAAFGIDDTPLLA